MRDDDRASVYRSENVVAKALTFAGAVDFHGSMLTLPCERKFASVESVQAFVDSVLSHPPVQERWGGVPAVRVVKARGVTRASYHRDEIRIPDTRDRWALREMVVLHEVAHHLTRHTAGLGCASHGPEFRSALVELVGLVVGPEVRLLLTAAYGDAGLAVDYALV